MILSSSILPHYAENVMNGKFFQAFSKGTALREKGKDTKPANLAVRKNDLDPLKLALNQ